MSAKVVLFLMVVLATLLAFCDAANFCKMGVTRRCKSRSQLGKRFDLEDDNGADLRSLDTLERRGNGGGYDFYPVLLPEYNWNRQPTNKHYADVAKKSGDDDLYPAEETLFELLLRKYLESQENDLSQKRDGIF
ncbi:uncharacterized protein [Ptychodera flava]|uniref:uncharacterized protein n=1 Tax=Ptychodera flava TaxID=63121 RepID=UPI003969EB68